MLLKVLDAKITVICFFRTKYSLPPSKVPVLLEEIRLTKPHFDTSCLNVKENPFAFSLPSLSCSYSHLQYIFDNASFLETDYSFSYIYLRTERTAFLLEMSTT